MDRFLTSLGTYFLVGFTLKFLTDSPPVAFGGGLAVAVLLYAALPSLERAASEADSQAAAEQRQREEAALRSYARVMSVDPSELDEGILGAAAANAAYLPEEQRKRLDKRIAKGLRVLEDRFDQELIEQYGGGTAVKVSRRAHIPREVRHIVWERDGKVCQDCGSDFDLQYDHIIPVAMGGSSNVENLQLLCGPCNRQKAATLG